MNCSIAVYKLHWKFCIIIWLEYPLFHSYWSSFINLYLQKYIPFHRNRKNIPKSQMESQETLNSQNNLEKEMETSHFLTSKWKSLSHVRLFVTPWTIQSMDSPGKNTEVGSHFILWGNLLNPGITPRSPTLQVDSLPAEPPGKLTSNCITNPQ